MIKIVCANKSVSQSQCNIYLRIYTPRFWILFGRGLCESRGLHHL